MPVLLMRGERTRASAAAVADVLRHALPQLRYQVLPGAGHLGPITHEANVSLWMLEYLEPLLEQYQPARAASLAWS